MAVIVGVRCCSVVVGIGIVVVIILGSLGGASNSNGLMNGPLTAK